MTDASSTAGDRRSRILGGGGGAGRNVAVALVSTAIVFTALGLLVVNSSGWEEVRQKFLNGEEFRTWFPDVLSAFWLDVKIFLVAEVVILAFALGIAVLRSLPGPVFFPIRALAIIYTDVFRGIPTILVVYILGFGVPGAAAVRRHPPTRSSGARSRSSWSTRRTWPRSTGPESSRCTPARRPPPARSACRAGRPCGS